MDRNQKNTGIELTPCLTGWADAQAAGARQIEVMLASSTKVVNLYQAVWSSWLQRRTEDMRMGMEAVRRMTECRDISLATEIYAGWASESARRIQEEIAATSEQVATLGTECMGALQGMANVTPILATPEKAEHPEPTSIRRAA